MTASIPRWRSVCEHHGWRGHGWPFRFLAALEMRLMHRCPAPWQPDHDMRFLGTEREK